MAGAVGAGGIGNVAIAYGAILFENFFKLRQLCLAVGICNRLRQSYLQSQNSVLSNLRLAS